MEPSRVFLGVSWGARAGTGGYRFWIQIAAAVDRVVIPAMLSKATNDCCNKYKINRLKTTVSAYILFHVSY
jgi:hypothetical protein